MLTKTDLIRKVLSILSILMFLPTIVILDSTKLTFETLPYWSFTNTLVMLGSFSVAFMVAMVLHAFLQFVKFPMKRLVGGILLVIALGSMIVLLFSMEEAFHYAGFSFGISDLKWSFWTMMGLVVLLIEETVRNPKSN